MNSNRKIQTAGIIFVLLLWQTASVLSGEFAVASPFSAFPVAFRMITDFSFLKNHMLITAVRVISALVLGSVTGFILGIFAGKYPLIMQFIEPMRRVLTTIPGIVAAVLAMLWLGLGSAMVIFLNSMFIIPVVYINVAESINKCDNTYIEMADVYQLSTLSRIKNIYIPIVSSALSAALVLVTGNSMRMTVLAEVLGTGEGLGFVLGISRARLDMPSLYGCVLISFAFVWAGEILIKLVIQRYCRA
ncbi:binding-protein-dependent transport systems inner membrane component [Denitrovibrio acetiphilus DSM 12809]|uniref:Binding-protein-dependent transport systems inner membrane component n=1 Tax=Denitrovibrio acetiphilus (strain DSM 12809 / NBRC 114555 / N2460) TaxID=522772 RepID=D4H1S9_DENA2|nr:ABC transporter permease subunit [Denitrovibrio acetiphilus]ADD68839.1 binding-protein-dependent transport systems inner membrane component [Denitrovibrio acetiphilus DSM 12809]